MLDWVGLFWIEFGPNRILYGAMRWYELVLWNKAELKWTLLYAVHTIHNIHYVIIHTSFHLTSLSFFIPFLTVLSYNFIHHLNFCSHSRCLICLLRDFHTNALSVKCNGEKFSWLSRVFHSQLSNYSSIIINTSLCCCGYLFSSYQQGK